MSNEFRYKQINDVWEEPQVYKDIKFYPLQVKDYSTYERVLSTLAVPKKHFKDVQIIKSSFLKFLLAIIPGSQEEQTVMAVMLAEILKTITRTEKVSFDCKLIRDDIQNPTLSQVRFYVYIDDVKFNEKEFDTIRDIILRQCNSSVDFVEQFDPELEKLLQSRMTDSLSMSEKIILFSCLSGVYDMDVIKNMSIFSFLRKLECLQSIDNTRLYQPLISSGQITMKGKFKTYNDPVDRTSRYSSILIKKDEFVKNSDIMKVAG